MSSLQAITTTAALHGAGDLAQTARQVREALGPSCVVEQDEDAVLVARCGSRLAYRLLGMWAKVSQVPMRVRFELAAQDQGTAVTAHMTSDPGWYVMTTVMAHHAYRVRFDELVADLERAGLSATGHVHHHGGTTGLVT